MMNLQNKLAPAMTIQCDWEDFISVPLKQIWIACKFRDEPSVHGTIRGESLICDTGDFTATFGRNSLCVKFNCTGHICRFFPTYKLFQNIHSKAVVSLDVTDGGLGVSSCDNGRLIIWDNTNGEVRRELTGHVSDINKCRFFPSGIVVLSAGSDMRIKIWSAETGLCPVTLTGHTKSVTDICIVDRGRNIISVSKDGTARLWHCGEAVCLDTFLKTSSKLNCCSIGRVPSTVMCCPSNNEKEIGIDDKLLLVGSGEGDVYAVVLSTRRILYSFNTNSPVNTITYFSQDQFIVGTEDGRLLVCSLNEGSVLRTIHESNSPVRCLTLLQDKGFLVGRHDGTVSYYSLHSDTQDRMVLTGPDWDPVYSIGVAGGAIFTGCRDGKIRKYKISDLIAGGV